MIISYIYGHQHLFHVEQIYLLFLNNSQKLFKVVAALLAHVLKHGEEKGVEHKSCLAVRTFSLSLVY